MEDDFLVSELIQLKYCRLLYILLEESNGQNFKIEDDELYQKIDLKIKELISEPEESFLNPKKGISLAKDLEHGLKKRITCLADHYQIMKDMIKLKNQTIDDLNK